MTAAELAPLPADTRPAADPYCLCGRAHPCAVHGPHIGPARHPWPPPPARRPDPFNGQLLLQTMAEYDHGGDNNRHPEKET